MALTQHIRKRRPKYSMLYLWRTTAVLTIALGLQSALVADTIFVNSRSLAPGSGSSWATAFADMPSALAAASSGDELWVAHGIYRPGNARTDSEPMRPADPVTMTTLI